MAGDLLFCKTIYLLKEDFQKLSLKGHFRVPKILTKSKTFVEKTSIICMRIQSHFLNNGFALSIALKQRPGATLKWPILDYSNWPIRIRVFKL